MFRNAVARAAVRCARASARTRMQLAARAHPISSSSTRSFALASVCNAALPAGHSRFFSSEVPPSDTPGATGDGASNTNDATPAKLPTIVDVTMANIEQVMVQSYGVPTILDCYANWCGPCQKLTPILEEIANTSNGKLRLAKMDVDANKELSTQLRVKSLPTVYGIAGGKVVDQFVGLPQQEEIQAFVAKLFKLGAEHLAAQDAGAGPMTPEKLLDTGTNALRNGDFATAQKNFDTLLALEESEEEGYQMKINRGEKAVQKTPDHKRAEGFAAMAHAKIAQVMLMEGKDEEATAYVATMKDDMKWSKHLDVPTVAQALAIVSLYAGAEAVDIAKLAETLEANPKDCDSRYTMALGLMWKGKPEDALKEAFLIIRQDREWEGGKAQAFCIDIFNAMGEESPIAVKGRRRLSNLLF